jgi:hypothetical protein
MSSDFAVRRTEKWSIRYRNTRLWFYEIGWLLRSLISSEIYLGNMSLGSTAHWGLYSCGRLLFSYALLLLPWSVHSSGISSLKWLPLSSLFLSRPDTNPSSSFVPVHVVPWRKNALHRLERGLVLNNRRFKPMKVRSSDSCIHVLHVTSLRFVYSDSFIPAQPFAHILLVCTHKIELDVDSRSAKGTSTFGSSVVRIHTSFLNSSATSSTLLVRFWKGAVNLEEYQRKEFWMRVCVTDLSIFRSLR